MINFYDISSIESLVDARRDKFYSEVYQRKVALEARQAAERSGRPSQIRRVVGVSLIRAGARLSGAPIQDLPRLQQSA